jgi:uncharacterized protein YjfI (DUF2170 family)
VKVLMNIKQMMVTLIICHVSNIQNNNEYR